MISSKYLKRFYRKTSRLRFVGTSVVTSIGIFLLQSALSQSAAMAQCAGFLCGPYQKIIADPGFASGAATFTTIFLGMNFLILVGAIAIVFKIVNANREGEEYRSFVNQGVATTVGLLFVNALGGYLIG